MNIVSVIIGALILFTLLAMGFYYKGWMESIITGKTVAILTLMTGGALAIKYFTSRAIAKSGIVSNANNMALQQIENFQDENQEFQPPPSPLQYRPQPARIPPPQTRGRPPPPQTRGRPRSPGRSMRRSLTNRPIVKPTRFAMRKKGNRVTFSPRRRGGTYDMNLGLESTGSLLSSGLF